MDLKMECRDPPNARWLRMRFRYGRRFRFGRFCALRNVIYAQKTDADPERKHSIINPKPSSWVPILHNEGRCGQNWTSKNRRDASAIFVGLCRCRGNIRRHFRLRSPLLVAFLPIQLRRLHKALWGGGGDPRRAVHNRRNRHRCFSRLKASRVHRLKKKNASYTTNYQTSNHHDHTRTNQEIINLRYCLLSTIFADLWRLPERKYYVCMYTMKVHKF